VSVIPSAATDNADPSSKKSSRRKLNVQVSWPFGPIRMVTLPPLQTLFEAGIHDVEAERTVIAVVVEVPKIVVDLGGKHVARLPHCRR
jgi:hypothetical protein